MQKRLRILFKRKIKARNRIHFVLLHIRHPISQIHDTYSFPIPSLKVYQSIFQNNQDAFITLLHIISIIPTNKFKSDSIKIQNLKC